MESSRKNPAAQALISLRWSKKTPEERSEIMRQVRAAGTHRKKLKKPAK